MEKVKKRDSNLELYRIIAMLAIIASHYNFDLYDAIFESPLSENSIFHALFGMWGKTGINSFMLISGYFMCKMDISTKKFIRLLTQIYFYNIIVSLVFIIAGYKDWDFTLLNLLWPFTRIHQSSFVTTFLFFYLFIPYINTLIHHLDKKSHLKLIILSLLVFTGFHTLPSFSVVMGPITWFSILFFIASYVRFYGFSNPLFNKSSFWGFITILCIFIAYSSIVFCLWRSEQNSTQMPFKYVTDLNSIMALLVSFSSFMFFKNLRIKYNPIINTWGGADVWNLVNTYTKPHAQLAMA